MSKITDLLGKEAEYYLRHECKTIDKSLLYLPGKDIIERVWLDSDRNIRTIESLQQLYGHGRLAHTGYVSILPVDQASSTLPEPLSPPIRFISTQRISSSWLSKGAVTLWLLRSVC